MATRTATGVWTQLDEVHGVDVRHVHQPGEHDFAIGDAAVTSCRNAVLSVWVGDCAPVVFYSADGALAAAHAGWRGALDGVLQSTVAAMPSAPLAAVLGPCIHPCCYEFGADDLGRDGGPLRRTGRVDDGVGYSCAGHPHGECGLRSVRRMWRSTTGRCAPVAIRSCSSRTVDVATWATR